jgi:site-specific recombinase XerD
MGSQEIEQFLNHLATQKHVAASTQNQALSALVFLYRAVLKRDFDWLDNLVRAKKPQRLPVVLTEGESRHVVALLDGRNWLMASLLYGSGLRLMECANAGFYSLVTQRFDRILAGGTQGWVKRANRSAD